MINLDDYSDIGTHWIFLYANNDNVTFLIFLGLNLFQIKYINKSIVVTNLFRVQAYDSIMCGCFCLKARLY